MNDRDQVIREHILAEDHANSHLGHVAVTNQSFVPVIKPWDDTNKYRVAMIMTPAWGVLFPPYNIAKLVGILRAFDYSTKVYDLNIESYHHLKNDYWRGEKYFMWTVRENFNRDVLPLIKPLLDNAITEIVKAKPKVIGFSIFNTNLFATEYMVNEIKRLLPDSCLIAGGPEVATTGALKHLPFNYLFLGEAEATFIELLENLPEEYPTLHQIGSTDSKLNLAEFPYTDYSDYNLGNYQHPDGVSIETSRGCVAECSFCSETYFWKFRSTSPERVVEEMEHQINKYNVRRFWFVDSLVNGNLKNFERLIDLILEKNLNIKWNSYARCDGRMTKQFIEKIVKSGCTCISYGVESGSQKVLLDMRKKVEVWEIENNLKHGADANLYNHVNWIIGFPTEEPIDFLHSLQLLANARWHIGAISPGFGAGPAMFSHMATEWKEYGMLGHVYVGDVNFLDAWYTIGYKNTILNRFMRIKMLHVWLDILSKHANSTINNSQKYSNITDFYSFTTYSKCVKYIAPDNYVKLVLTSEESFEHIIENEYLALMYSLYLYFGEFKLSLNFNPELDKTTFGDWLAKDYTSRFQVAVNRDGAYKIELTHSLKDPNTGDTNQSFESVKIFKGNIKDFISKDNQVKETVHVKYRKKVIPITNLLSDV